jgi:hypothetical protein
MDDSPPRIERHEAVDRFGKKVLRTAHELTAALAENDAADEEPVVLRTDGPHRSIRSLMVLIDDALDDERPSGGASDGRGGQTGGS